MSTELSEAVAGQLAGALADVCAVAGLPAGDARLIKYTMNAVYRVDRAVVRLARGAAAKERAALLVRVAAALDEAGVPVIRLLPGIRRPVFAGDWVATVWSHVETSGAEPLPADLAVPLRGFHNIASLSDSGPDLPLWSPVEKAQGRIDEAENQTGQPRSVSEAWAASELGYELTWVTSWLREWTLDIGSRLADVSWPLPTGVIHGDAHTGNVLLPAETSEQAALLCDLDGVCLGPPEWDLTPTAHGAARFGRSVADYRSFAETYGWDVTEWDGWPLLRELRELQLVTSVLPTLSGRPAVALQLALRIRSLLAGDTAAVWSRYN